MAWSLNPATMPQDAACTSLQAGRVNRVFRVAHPQGDLVRRELAPTLVAQRLGADPAVEVRAQALASRVGLAPEILHHDAVAGVTWMPFVEGAPLENLWWQDAQRRRAVRHSLETLRAIEIGAELPQLDLRARLLQLQGRLQDTDACAAQRTADDCARACAALERYDWSSPAESCLVHSDLGPHNMLVRADGSIVMLDWEYAHRGHVLEDLAGLWVAAGMHASQLRPLLVEWCAVLEHVHDAPGRLETLVVVRRTLDAQWESLATG